MCVQVRYKTLEELEEYRPMMAQHQSHLDEEEIEQDEDTEGFFVLMGERTKYIRWAVGPMACTGGRRMTESVPLLSRSPLELYGLFVNALFAKTLPLIECCAQSVMAGGRPSQARKMCRTSRPPTFPRASAMCDA